MFEEYDVVTSLETINTNVPVDTKGVILMILDKYNNVYEVEFVNNNNITLDVIEVNGEQLKKYSL